MTEASSPGHDAEAFLRAVQRRVGALGAAQARSLACAIAERHLGGLGEDEGGTRAVFAKLRKHRGPLPGAQLEAGTRELQRTREMIDPDRPGAADKSRALDVMKLALASCTESAPPSAPFAVARAALAVRALRWPAKDDDAKEMEAERQQLATRWAWDAVQDEARWLAAQLEQEESEPQPVREDSSPDAAPPPESPSPDAGAASGLTLPLAGRTLRFVRKDHDARFHAEVDGRRCLIRARSRVLEVTTVETTGDDPPWQESSLADLTALLAMLHAGAVPRVEAGRTVVKLHKEGAHFRQNEWTTVAISLTADEVVEIETTHARQDESYY